ASVALPTGAEYLSRKDRRKRTGRVRLGARAVRVLTDRIAALEAQVASLSPPSPSEAAIEGEGAGRLKIETSIPHAESVEDTRQKTGGPIVDARRPDPGEVEAKAQAVAEQRAQSLANYRRNLLAMNLA